MSKTVCSHCSSKISNADGRVCTECGYMPKTGGTLETVRGVSVISAAQLFHKVGPDLELLNRHTMLVG